MLAGALAAVLYTSRLLAQDSSRAVFTSSATLALQASNSTSLQ